MPADPWLPEDGLGEEGEEEREGHREALGVMYILVILIMHNSFRGVYLPSNSLNFIH